MGPAGIRASRLHGIQPDPGQTRGAFVWGSRALRIEIGILFSREGSYRRLSEACRTGALAAVEAVNADPSLPIELVPVERDPQGNVDRYGLLCAEILRDTSARHIVGCVTSWSRKEVIPTLEKLGGSLWYPCPYEGFETSDRVVYANACANQHLLPLLTWAFARYGRNGYLTGSNYIWGWEMNRVARDMISESGGEVAGERYLPLGEEDVGRLIDEIRATRPDFILNNLIGPSSYSFLVAYRALGAEDAHFTPARCPVLSCNLTECETEALGPAAEGLISAGPYFRAGDAPHGSAFEAAAHEAVRTLALRLLRCANPTEATLPELLGLRVEGGLRIDTGTHHAALPVVIAQMEAGVFRVLERWDSVVADPYLCNRDRQLTAPRASLSVVK
ncbi:transporter substrate-binding protein [Halovulum dunhuangense]|uniref:Transporter substrate-binding protein n=1 Tax=Halovulum dunhuangense TaxID=1505036 RepID=A0A849L6A0_9RHOB|nr:transporter substrate-binding protein [Halovulum dunhuangense]NNU82038.1 transporter substrate-binding protein [Halovulum dunhuangense]